MKRLTIRHAAASDIREAVAWYDGQRTGLGQEYYDEIVACIRRIAAKPDAFAAVYEDLREGVPYRFPYRVYYRIRGNWIVIVAVIHTARDPAVWQSRR